MAVPSGAGAVRAVLFDADGVVQENPPDWDAALRRFGDGFVDDLFAAEEPAMVGERSFPDVLADVIGRWQVPVGAAELVEHWCEIEVCPDTVAVVGSLRAAGVGCYLASNQHSYRASFMRRRLGYDEVFDGEFYSCDLGAMKSAPEFFSRVLDRLGMPAGAVLLVDDGESYVDVALAAGLRAVRWCTDDGIDELRRLLSAHGLPL
jgi:putative hydrolase of the HAD superfamily